VQNKNVLPRSKAVFTEQSRSNLNLKTKYRKNPKIRVLATCLPE